jgi:hypothetical protein
MGVEKRDGEDWRDVYDRSKREESERLKNATARLREKNGKIKEAKLARQIVVIDPTKTPVLGNRKRSHPFASIPFQEICVNFSGGKSIQEEEYNYRESETGYLGYEIELCSCAEIFGDKTDWVD